MTHRLAPKLLPLLLLAAFSGSAAAAGFQLLEQNASGIGNAYAGSAAVAENASTIFYNAAGLTRLGGTQLSVGADYLSPSFKFSNGNSSVPTAFPVSTPLSGNGGDGGRAGVLPNGYLSTQLTPNLFAGLGISAPFGLETQYSNGWLGAAESVKFSVRTVNVNPTLAYKVNDTVSLGFGLDWQRLDVEYQKQALPFNAGFLVPSVGNAVLNANDSTWGWNAGALFTVSPSTTVGVSYRSEMKYHLTGSLAVPAIGPLPASSSPASADLTLPDTFIMSVAQKLSDKWELLGDVSRTGWGKIPQVDILAGANSQTLNTDFRNTWRVALGANYRYSDLVKLKFGVAYDQTPVKGADTRLASMPDNNRVWFSTGAQYAVAKGQTVDVGVAYLYVRNADINASTASPVGTATLNGTYEDSVWIAGAQYSVAF